MLEFQFGVYHYSYVSSLENAVLEAKNCLKFIENKKFDLPVFYDLEESSIIKLGRDTITKCAIALSDQLPTPLGETQFFKPMTSSLFAFAIPIINAII